MARWGISIIGIINALNALDTLTDGVVRVSKRGWVIRVGGGPENVHYHWYVEVGAAAGHDPQPYIEPALREGQRRFPSFVREALREEDNHEDALDKAFEKLAKFVHEDMVGRAPQDTGALKRSIELFEVRRSGTIKSAQGFAPGTMPPDFDE